MYASRFEPSSISMSRVIDRDRLTARLAQRFEQRLALIVAPAGSGKTTALSMAMEQNRLAPAGVDVWLSVVPADRDRDHLCDGLAATLGAATADLVSVVDAVWSRAPERVALILDDVHLLAGSSSVDLVAELVEQLPANGSVVVISRVDLPLPVARLRAHGHVLELGADDLDLTDDELRRLCVEREVELDIGLLPRHPASADLKLVSGTQAGSAFVWEEILQQRDPDEVVHLQRLAVLDQLDDALIARLTDGAFEADRLFDGLPLVEYGDGSYRFHDILRHALTDRLAEGERDKTLSVAAELEADRDRLAAAVRLYDLAGDGISAHDCARRLALGPILSMSSYESAEVRRVIERRRPDSHLNVVFDALRHFAGNEEHAPDALVTAADAARAASDHDLEAVCRHRAAQSYLLRHDSAYTEQVARIAELGTNHRLASALGRYYASIEAQLVGDGATAADHVRDLDALDALGPMHAVQVRAERMSDLGRPEAVIAGLDRIDLGQMPQAVSQWVGMAMLQCAIGSPEQALGATLETSAASDARGFSHPASFTCSVASTMALACGDVATAIARVRRARAHADTGVGPSAEAVVRFAEAALIADRGDLDAAAAHVADLTEGDRPWPSRAELWAMPLAYVLQPGRRAVLDHADLGPTLSIARDAGRAVVDLLGGDTAPAAALPWDRLDLLRTHVTPVALIALACGAAATRPEANAALTSLPRSGVLLARLAGRDDVLGEIARRHTETITSPEPFGLDVELLGPVRVSRSPDDEEPISIDLARRPKAAELLAFLTERRRVDRLTAITELWPDHDDERKALSSLRTTLGIVNDVLDPDREKGSSAFHLRIEGDLLELDDRVTTDVERFELAIDEARSADQHGLPLRALEGYRAALESYRGDFLHGLDVAWAEFARVRLRSLATSAMCRVSELTAASGEPEIAARWAERALSDDPLDERALRCLASALDASGDRSGARRCIDDALGRLETAGVAPSTDTIRLADRLR